MRYVVITLCIMTSTCICCAEKGGDSIALKDNPKVTLRVEKMDLQFALGYIAHEYGLKFQVLDKALESEKVSFDYNNLPLNEAILDICHQSNAVAEVSKNGTLVISQSRAKGEITS